MNVWENLNSKSKNVVLSFLGESEYLSTNGDTQIDQIQPIPLPIQHTERGVYLDPSEEFVLLHPESPGFFVRQKFLGKKFARRLREEAIQLDAAGFLHRAGVGKGDTLRISGVRSDKILWLTSFETEFEGIISPSPFVSFVLLLFLNQEH